MPTHRSNQPKPRVAVLCGGVGAARFLRGLLAVVSPVQVTAIVNTGDDVVLNGLAISPDLDTITYTLADAIDPERGWGLSMETWQAMDALGRYASVRPTDSAAAPTWFNLGDRDLATHMYRTARLGEGADLTTVTGEIARAWNLNLSILPMTNGRVSTKVTRADTGEEIGFQNYFVELRHGVAVSAVRFDRSGATLSEAARAAIVAADAIVIAPSNPLVSIGPIRALPDVDELLTERRERVVAISPIVAGAALKGPADRMLDELGLSATVTAVAELYQPIAASLIIDPADGAHVDAIEAIGMRAVVQPSVMATPAIAAELAAVALRTAQRV